MKCASVSGRDQARMQETERKAFWTRKFKNVWKKKNSKLQQVLRCDSFGRQRMQRGRCGSKLISNGTSICKSHQRLRIIIIIFFFWISCLSFGQIPNVHQIGLFAGQQITGQQGQVIFCTRLCSCVYVNDVELACAGANVFVCAWMPKKLDS